MEKLKQANQEQLAKLDSTIEDAETNLGEMEVREANLRKAEYLSRIGSYSTICGIADFRKRKFHSEIHERSFSSSEANILVLCR